MINTIKKIKAYRKENFSCWLEFIMCFGLIPLENGGYLLFIYGWGGIIAMLGMYLMLKYA